MDHISRVEVFLEVAKHESFAAAARELGITGPAVSKQVQALEDRLGVKLLYRTTRKVSLTEEGALYFQQARSALEDLAEAEQQIQELKACPTGKLKVNAPMSFGSQYLTEPIAQFAKQYPEVELEVYFDDRWVDVVGEGYDVVIRIDALADSSLRARKLADCPIILCASPAYIETHGQPTSPADLADYPAVVYSQHGQSQEWRFQANDGSTGHQKLNRNFASNTAPMQVQACLNGIGLAPLPIFCVAEFLDSGELIELLPDYQTHPQRGIYALYPQNRHLSTRVRLFIDWLYACAQDFPWD
ncbi:MAG: LysR family transcriptional regulator [Pseudomonadota bacterium]